MQRGTTYTNERLGKIEIVSDFLPRPEDLVLREEGVKVTLSLSRRSLEFFKAHASRAKVPYQRIIRSLLETYADSYRHEPVRRRAGGRRSTKSAPR